MTTPLQFPQIILDEDGNKDEAMDTIYIDSDDGEEGNITKVMT